MSENFEEMEKKILENLGKDKPIQVINTDAIVFENPIPGVHVAKTPIANAVWINTPAGTVLIDTLINHNVASIMKERITDSGGLVKSIIYTHHHLDHIGGSMVFSEHIGEAYAHRYFGENLEKYGLLKPHRAKMASVQFNIPANPDRIPPIVQPTQTFDQSMVFAFGDRTFELYHGRAETDDSIWAYVPELKTAVVGDLIIAGFPNIGNPFKPVRFALSWARTLEQIKAKKPQVLIGNGAKGIYQGSEIDALLDITIEAIYAIHDQVVEHINAGTPLDEMIHLVKLPDHLKDHHCLRFVYSRPEFAVYNIYRWYHGYYDFNPANLLPRPDKEVNQEIFNLIGDKEAILKRSTQLLENGQAQLALQVLDVLYKKEPDNIDARKLRLLILQKCCEQDYCLMSRNAWVHAMQKDKAFLDKKGLLAE
jgi:alkyl sulfatase BDS1-like metallo-beta-lactamase superfamily hydrolase